MSTFVSGGELSHQFLEELWNRKNLSIINQSTTEGYILHLPRGILRGQKGLQHMAEYYSQSFSDIHVTLDLGNQISYGNQVITPLTWDIQVSLREVNPVDQTTQKEIARKISAAGVAVDRFEYGRIVESRNTLDVLYWLHNIQLLSRNPSFVQLLPGLQTCPPDCPDGFPCNPAGFCVQP